MLTFEPFEGSLEDWGAILQQFPDREIFQTPAWLRFLAESQSAEPVVAVLREGTGIVGYFAGMIVRKLGFRILGSPFIGWTTEHMGIRLLSGVSKRAAVAALETFAFERLGCVHLELSDAGITPDDLQGMQFSCRTSLGTVLDLTRSEDEIYACFSSKSCRYSIRKAIKSGVSVEEAFDDAFAADYYTQLQDVFAKHSLVPTYDQRRVELLIKHLLPTGNLLLLRARDSAGRCIATTIVPGMNKTAVFWGNASWRKDQHLCPNELLQWYAIRYWKGRGITSYDLACGNYKRKYGGDPVNSYQLRKSKYRWLARARNAASWAFRLRQRILGWCKRPPREE
jgi:hypothetical protein